MTENKTPKTPAEVLDLLATSGLDALRNFVDGEPNMDNPPSAAVSLAEMLEFARVLGETDLRNPSFAPTLRLGRVESFALDLLHMLNELERLREASRRWNEKVRESADKLCLAHAARERAVVAMNEEQDRADYLCGVGIDASAQPPAATRAIDESIEAREKFVEELHRYAEVARVARSYADQLQRSEEDAALISVACVGATAL